MSRRRLILDVDTGTDDAVAIMLAALHPALDLVACTTVNGNVEVQYCTDNSLRTIEFIGRPEIPVFEGLSSPLARPDFPIPRAQKKDTGVHGRELPIPPTSLKKQEVGAVEFLIETFRNATDEIVLMPVGPLSNIGATLAVFPKLAELVPEIVIMGGGHLKGNVTPSAEFNIWADPEASAKVFAAKFRKITLVPLDATHQALVSGEKCRELAALGTNAGLAAARFIEQRIRGYDATQPMAVAGSAPVHDALCVAYLVEPDIIQTQHRHVDVETHGTLTTGRTVIDTHFRGGKPPNCHVAFGADQNRFCDILIQTFGAGKRATPEAAAHHTGVGP
jgi:inosine-uridine nucleoside N-ribohydrolase